jgi:hypothetical protein
MALETDRTALRHLRIGWGAILLFLSLGALLEALHGFKLGFYLDLANATRRHLWTLAHAHGTLLGILNVVFALSLRVFCEREESWQRAASVCLFGATVLLPSGFFLGGLVIYAGDPGLGVLLVPLGGLLLFIAALLTFRGVSRTTDQRPPS